VPTQIPPGRHSLSWLSIQYIVRQSPWRRLLRALLLLVFGPAQQASVSSVHLVGDRSLCQQESVESLRKNELLLGTTVNKLICHREKLGKGHLDIPYPGHYQGSLGNQLRIL
jgi:hypothetical protein